MGNRSNKHLITLSLLLALQILFLIGCLKPDDAGFLDDDPANRTNISLEGKEFKAYQIVKAMIDMETTYLSSQEYSGSIGDTDITLLRVSSSELVFIIPDLAAGTYDLKIKINDKLAVSELRVIAGEAIANPVSYINDYVQKALASFDEILIDEGIDELPSELQEIKNSLIDAQAEFANLSEKEKNGVAVFLQNNDYLLNTIENSLGNLTKKQTDNSVTNIIEASIIVAGGVLLAKTLAISGTAAVTTLVVVEIGFRIFTGRSSPLFRKIKQAISDIFNITYFPQNHLADIVYDQAQNTFTNFSDKAGRSSSNPINSAQYQENIFFPDNPNSELYSYKSHQIQKKDELPAIFAGKEITFSIKPTYRTFQESDANSSEELIAKLISAYNDLLSLWNDGFINKYGSLPGFELKTEKVFADSLSKFQILIDSTFSYVSVLDIDGDAKVFTVTFNTLSLINNVFAFEIQYTDKGITAKEWIQAMLLVEEPVPDNIAIVSGDNQSGYLGQPLAEPIVLLVTDQYENPIPGAVVNFISEYYYQYNSSEQTAVTGDDGMVRFFWSLGTTDRDQTALIRSIKPNTDHPLSGSPMYINATGKSTCTTFSEGGYESTQIGNQIWMAKNLNWVVSPSYVYPGLDAEYGRLYTWEAAQKACPSGWRLPSDQDWNVLFGYLSNNGFAGTEARALKSSYGWNSSGSFSGNGSDNYCFTALPGGQYYGFNDFSGATNFGGWWGSDVHEPSDQARVVSLSTSTTPFMSYQNKEMGFSVRCIKN